MRLDPRDDSANGLINPVDHRHGCTRGRPCAAIARVQVNLSDRL